MNSMFRSTQLKSWTNNQSMGSLLMRFCNIDQVPEDIVNFYMHTRIVTECSLCITSLRQKITCQSILRDPACRWRGLVSGDKKCVYPYLGENRNNSSVTNLWFFARVYEPYILSFCNIISVPTAKTLS